MATTTPSKDAAAAVAAETETPGNAPTVEVSVSTQPRFIAVAWLPEMREPMLQEIMGGGFGVTFPATEETMFLHPGTNKVRRDLWERVKDLPVVQEQMSHRTIEVIEIGNADGGDPDGRAMFSIKDVEQSAALRMVALARFTEQLEYWHDSDDRMTVRSAIRRRIEALKKGDDEG